jgi:hypothetical protein
MSIQRDHALINEIDACIERICDLGCGEVFRIIDLMERGDVVPELNGVNTEIHLVVLRELKTIMAVYDARDGGASYKIPDKSNS